MSYIEETLKLIASDEMREHLHKWKHKLHREDYIDIVQQAPICLEQKIQILDLIAKQTKDDAANPIDTEHHNPSLIAKYARRALDELHNNSSGDVFLLERYCYDEENIHARELFTTFEAIKNHIQKVAGGQETSKDGGLWFRLEKWLPHKDGNMKHFMYWYLSNKGEVLYYGYPLHSMYDSDYYMELCTSFASNATSGDMVLTTPFKTGDIIIAVCSPFVKPTKVLIFDIFHIGDDTEPAYSDFVRFIGITPKGKIDDNSLEHTRFYNGSCFSLLYRATVYDGELDETEAPLGVINKAIKENPKLVDEIKAYMRSLSDPASEKARLAKESSDYDGVEWEDLKNKFGL